MKVSISTSASVNLTPVFPDSSAMQTAVLGKYGVGEFFKGGANGDKVVLAFETGGRCRRGRCGGVLVCAAHSRRHARRRG